MWSPRTLVCVGFIMLFLTTLQGWGMVGVIATTGQSHPELLHELKRLHNLGLSGGFLAVSLGLSLIILPIPEHRSKLINKILLPSLLIAPLAFSDRMLVFVVGSIPLALQALFYCLQGVSALGITVSLALVVVDLLRNQKPSPQACDT